MCTDHILCIGGHLGCFCLLAIVRNAAVNTCGQVISPSLLSVLVGIHLEVELLDHTVNLLPHYFQNVYILNVNIFVFSNLIWK